MSEREKPSDPRPYYDAHVFCFQPPAGHPRPLLRGEGQAGAARYMKVRAGDAG
jgi:hypothetical protein